MKQHVVWSSIAFMLLGCLLVRTSLAAPGITVADLLPRLAELESRVTALETQNAAQQTALKVLKAALIAEAAARQATDATLQTTVANETAARGDADTRLQASITAEASARQAADTALQARVATLEGQVESLIRANSPGALIKDSNGVFLGTFLYLPMESISVNYFALRNAPDGTAVAIPLDAEGNPSSDIQSLYYEGSDCRGIAYSTISEPPPSPTSLLATGIVSQKTLYYFVASTPLVTATALSSSFVTDNPSEHCAPPRIFTPPSTCCINIAPPIYSFTGTQINNVRPAMALDLSEFVPPFHVEVQQ